MFLVRAARIGHKRAMRMILLAAFLSIGPAGESAAAGQRSDPPGDLAALERSWHDCVREAFRRQPRTRSRAASERSALDECQAGEDAYVAAAMRAEAYGDDPGLRRGLTERARAWAASVAAGVIDPVSSWLGALRP